MKRFPCLMLAFLLILSECTASAEELSGARPVFEAIQSGRSEDVYRLFSEEMQSAMTVDSLSAVLPQLEIALGKLLSVGEEEQTDGGAYVVSALRLCYEKGDILFAVTWQNGKIAGLYCYPTAPKATTNVDLPEEITEEDVSVGDPALSGTLTLPKGASTPLPAVVLLHGSGPNDRDETVGQTKLFRDLAWDLAARRIAVLRFDKRTYVYGSAYTQENLKAFTVSEESLNDAAAAAQLLRADPRIDPERIFLIGHSLGAMLSPRAAQENAGLFCGIVLLSGSPKTLAEIVLSQNQAAADALPVFSRAIGQIQVDKMRKDWEAVLNGTAEEARQKKVFGQPAYYFWEMAQHDTGEILKFLDIPALIINGGQDFQVTDQDSIDAWRALDLPDTVRLIYLPDLNHLLMQPDAPEGVKGTAAEYDISCHADETVIREIAQFILE